MMYLNKDCNCRLLELKAVNKAMPTSKVSPWTEFLVDLAGQEYCPSTLLQSECESCVACQKFSLKNFHEQLKICEICAIWYVACAGYFNTIHYKLFDDTTEVDFLVFVTIDQLNLYSTFGSGQSSLL